MEEVNVSVPNAHLGDLRNLVDRIGRVTNNEEAEISFEFVIATLFPTSWKNIQADLKRQYTLGYLQGRADKEAEYREYHTSDDDSDCYCE